MQGFDYLAWSVVGLQVQLYENFFLHASAHSDPPLYHGRGSLASTVLCSYPREGVG